MLEDNNNDVFGNDIPVQDASVDIDPKYAFYEEDNINDLNVGSYPITFVDARTSETKKGTLMTISFRVNGANEFTGKIYEKLFFIDNPEKVNASKYAKGELTTIVKTFAPGIKGLLMDKFIEIAKGKSAIAKVSTSYKDYKNVEIQESKQEIIEEA